MSMLMALFMVAIVVAIMMAVHVAVITRVRADVSISWSREPTISGVKIYRITTEEMRMVAVTAVIVSVAVRAMAVGGSVPGVGVFNRAALEETRINCIIIIMRVASMGIEIKIMSMMLIDVRVVSSESRFDWW